MSTGTVSVGLPTRVDSRLIGQILGYTTTSLFISHGRDDGVSMPNVADREHPQCCALQDSRAKSSRFKSQEFKIQEPRAKSQEPRAKSKINQINSVSIGPDREDGCKEISTGFI